MINSGPKPLYPKQTLMLPLCVEFMKIYLGFAFLHTIDDNAMMKKVSLFCGN
jgi:hypothetical protein